MRIDVFLTRNGYVESRTDARRFVEAGTVKVGGKIITKPSFEVSEDTTDLTIDVSLKKYVSRGGLKLEAALTEFGLAVSGKLALDIGASSGGFTDCLLQNGAAHVISVDSGSGQIATSLRSDSRVTVIEGYNARYMKTDDFEYMPEIAVMDVSFISATYIIPAVYGVLSAGGDFICLIKPQFEVGRAGLGKGGIVKDDKIRRAAVDGVIASAVECGFECIKLITSPIKGGDGNIEYLAHFRK
ncbi:MAG: TlyA family RNA methyltransferase [Clostridia bacterium]|nr:TlyA family RNA methyltransferase [Clostridia bacterium]